MTDEFRPFSRKLYPVDWLVIGYSLLMVIVIAFLGRPLAHYAGGIAFYITMAILTLLIVRFVDETRSRWHAFVRLLYPAMMFFFFYRATGDQMFLLFDRFFDSQVVTWEESLLGLEPTLFIDRFLPNTWLTEILSLCYFCYYLILPGLLIPLFLRRDDRGIREFLAAASLTFFVSYLIFWLYPAEGPRWFLETRYANDVEGPVFRPLVEFVMDNAAVRGGAMPSSHTGVALVALLFCFRCYRRAGWLLLPIVIGLAAGTVWGRYHYLSDVIVGASIGAFAFWVMVRSGSHKKVPAPVGEPQMLLRTQDVS